MKDFYFIVVLFKLLYFPPSHFLLAKKKNGLKCGVTYIYEETFIMNNNQNGRSMIEMLGVLAIIGVLSVGAIAGYQKAMFKYKLNKQAEQLNQIINSVAIKYKSFPKTDTYTRWTQTFVKLGDIPKEMIKANSNYIYDIFNTSISITSSIEDTFNITLSLSLEGSDTESLEICKNVIRVAQQNSHILLYVSSVSNNEEEGGYNAKIFYGDKECNGNRICLRSISLDNIYELCTYHTDKKNQHFKIEFLRS